MRYKVGAVVVGTKGMVFKIVILKILNDNYVYSHDIPANKSVHTVRKKSIESKYLDEYSELDKQYTRKQKLIQLNDTSAVVK